MRMRPGDRPLVRRSVDRPLNVELLQALEGRSGNWAALRPFRLPSSLNCWLPCLRRKRPCRHRAAEQRDELAPSYHSITSSARASVRGLEVDHKFVLGRRLYRKVAGLLALEDTIDISGRTSMWIDGIKPISDQAAGADEKLLEIDCGQFVPCRQRDDKISMNDR